MGDTCHGTSAHPAFMADGVLRERCPCDHETCRRIIDNCALCRAHWWTAMPVRAAHRAALVALGGPVGFVSEFARDEKNAQVVQGFEE